jgi:hypothetical protein
MQPSPTADLGAIETPAVQDAPPNAITEPVSNDASASMETPPVVETPGEGTTEAKPESTPAAPRQPEQPAGIEDDFDIKPDRVEGKQYFFREQKAKQLLAHADFVRALDSMIPGATVELIQQHYMRSLGSQQMLDDFSSGNPEQIGRWLDFHISPQTNPNSVALVAEGLMQRLPQVAPQVYSHIRSQVIGGQIQDLYERAATTRDEQLLLLAQNLDFHLTGKFKTADDLRQRDPFQSERERFEQERRQFYAERAQEHQSWLDLQMSQADEQALAAQTEEIEAALAPVAQQFKGKPQWGYMVHELTQKVEDAKKSNPGWMREYELIRQRAKRAPSAESKKAMADMMRTFVKRAVAPHRKGVIDAVAQPILNASAQATTNAQQQAAARPEPGGTNRVVNPTTDLAARAKELRAKGGTVEDIMALAR